MLYQSNTIEVITLTDGLVKLNFNNKGSSVNVFDSQTINDFSEALSVLERRDNIKGLLITSGKKVFMAGADVIALESSRGEGPKAVALFLAKNNSNFNRLEDLPFPVVVAINGAAMGGGLEVSLAADCRVMSMTAIIGLPETNLGILPGWGGTVRLPRLIGLTEAAGWIVTGKPKKAVEALESGAVDAIAEPSNLEAKALELLQCQSEKIDYRAIRAKKTSRLSDSDKEISADLAILKTKLKNDVVPSKLLVLESMEKSARVAREEALAFEQSAITEAVMTNAGGAMLGNFVNDQKLGHLARNWANRTNSPLSNIAVLGAGIMGGGISYVSALKGIDTQMKDIMQTGLDAGMLEADSLLSRRVKRGQMDENKKSEVMAHIHPTLDYSGFDKVNFIVEAVVENPKIKHSVLAEVEGQAPIDTVIASNTSTISITHLAKSLKRPENFCGMHFFNPVHAMPLVEIIRGEKTSDETISRTVAYASAIGKKPIVVNDCPGFLVNRALFPYILGLSMLLRDGADFQEVDRVMEQWGWPMGPAYLADVIGLDTVVHCETVLAEGFPDRMSKPYPFATDILAEAGLYGQKNGKGFYNYNKDNSGRLQKLASDQAYELLEPHCAKKRLFSDEDIIARMMIPMATEMARIMDDNIVDNAYEADLGLLYGLGFPAFRGGVLRWMDSLGLDKICAMAEKYKGLGKLYEPTDSMILMAASKKGFYAS